MPMEFLIVRCSEHRKVLVDGVAQGHTGELIEIPAGSYTISLEPSGRCQPPTCPVVLLNTTALKPCEVKFDLV